MLAVKQFLRRWARRLVLATLAYVMWLNLAVGACAGSAVNPLSPFFLREKRQAVVALALHYLRHPITPEHPNPLGVLRKAARKHRLPPSLLVAVARVESGLRPHCISRAGAMGMMQLMPETARELAVRDPFDTVQAADGAARYLARLWLRYNGDVRRVAAAYNAGPGAVARRGKLRLPQETRAYVARVLRGMGQAG